MNPPSWDGLTLRCYSSREASPTRRSRRLIERARRGVRAFAGASLPASTCRVREAKRPDGKFRCRHEAIANLRACGALGRSTIRRWARLASVPITLAWVGDGAPRMELAHAERHGRELTAVGTQLGATYELRYRLEPELLRLELVGQRSLEVGLDDADFFDLGWSPLFNSLPVMRDGLMEPGPARDYVMRWIDVPSLEVTTSEQQYEPLGNGLVRFRSGSFTAEIRFDENEFVVDYPGIARRAGVE
jgi:hypothetical protein